VVLIITVPDSGPDLSAAAAIMLVATNTIDTIANAAFFSKTE
jgi:hypothetical protein